MFFGDISSSQRSESTNRIFNYMSGRLTLTKFENQYEARVKELRDTEPCNDYRTRGGQRC